MSNPLSKEREKEIRHLVVEWPTYGDEGHDAVIDLLAEIDRLRAERKPVAPWKVMAELEDKLAKAIVALEPFANAADLVERGPADAYLWTRTSNVPGEPYAQGISVSDVRRARQTLKELKG